MNSKTFGLIGFGLIAALILVFAFISVFSVPDSCKTRRFLEAFSHPLFLVEKRSALFANYDFGKYGKVSAEYPLSSVKFKAIKKEKADNAFECARNMLVIKFDDSSAKWRFEDGPNIDGRPDKVDGYKFANLPWKVQKKLLKKFREARKHLTKGLEKDIGIRLKVEKPKN